MLLTYTQVWLNSGIVTDFPEWSFSRPVLVNSAYQVEWLDTYSLQKKLICTASVNEKF